MLSCVRRRNVFFKLSSLNRSFRSWQIDETKLQGCLSETVDDVHNMLAGKRQTPVRMHNTITLLSFALEDLVMLVNLLLAKNTSKMVVLDEEIFSSRWNAYLPMPAFRFWNSSLPGKYCRSR